MIRSLSRAAFRTCNRVLSHAGLRLERAELDFDARPIDAASLDALIEELAATFDGWVSRQNLYQPRELGGTAMNVRYFFDQWLASPFRRPVGGSRLNNLLWLFLVARSYGPDVIIDSGTYEGASAWALKMGAPSADVRSFDIDLSQLRVRVEGVRYVEADWTTSPVDWSEGSRTLAYFDDHVDQARRLIEAADRHCSLLVFDDDYPISSYHQMAPSPHVLPKIEFVLNQTLKHGQTLEWRNRSGTHRWEVDAHYLSRARERIASTERLPFTGLTTNIMQTPYRLVVPR